jgi:DNA-binding NarL/FixJ family response regulator
VDEPELEFIVKAGGRHGGSDPARKQVLIVEDQFLASEFLKIWVEAFGFEVCGVATNADDAIALAVLHKPYYVLMDVRLEGDRDGIAAAMAIRERIKTRIIYCTGSNEPSTMKRINEAHPFETLIKPIDPEALGAALTRELLGEDGVITKPDLHCLVYVSRMAPVMSQNLQQMVRSILTVAQHRNAVQGVTGLLIFNQNFFAQVLEGDLATIEKSFGRISLDPRHTMPSVLLKTAIEDRSFGAWTMCARQLSKLDNDVLDRFERQGAFPPLPQSGARLLDQLRAIGRVHQAAFDRQNQDALYL